MHDGIDDLIAHLDDLDQRHRWQRSLIDLLDGLEPTTEDPKPRSRGIDLAAKHGDIRKLVGKFGIEACLANGWEFEDLLSDVYTKIATSNLGGHPYDPTKSGLGHYVHLVTKSVITNRWRRQTQRGRVTRCVAIDDPAVEVQLGEDAEVEAVLHLEDVRRRDPETFDRLAVERRRLSARRSAFVESLTQRA